MPVCKKCRGCGQLADSENQEPWSVWLALPLASSAAVLGGIVRPITCPECKGEGKVDVKQADIDKACSHLRAALIQMLPDKDDPIIIEHVHAAYRLLGGGRL